MRKAATVAEVKMDIEIAGRRVIREPEVKKKTHTSRTTRWRKVRRGLFPAPVELGPNSIGWFEDEVEAWLAARPRRNYGAQAA